MKIYIYKGGLSLVAKSGVGSAIRHQEKMLRAAKVTVTDVWKEADIVQINTVLPDSPLMACDGTAGKTAGEKGRLLRTFHHGRF